MVYHSILDNMKEQHTKHVTYKIGYHFVWCPTYRKNILTGKIAHFVESEIRRLCEANHWAIDALHIQEDHVHLFVRVDVESLLSQWVGGLKRAMSVAVSTTRLWQPGFFDHVLRNDEAYSEKWE